MVEEGAPDPDEGSVGRLLRRFVVTCLVVYVANAVAFGVGALYVGEPPARALETFEMVLMAGWFAALFSLVPAFDALSTGDQPERIRHLSAFLAVGSAAIAVAWHWFAELRRD